MTPPQSDHDGTPFPAATGAAHVALNELAEVIDSRGNPIYLLVPVDDGMVRLELSAPVGGRFDEAALRGLISSLTSGLQRLLELGRS